MSQNNLEHQTNKQALTREQFANLYEEKITQLIQLEQYGDAMVQFADVLRRFDCEAELRVELLYGFAISQTLFAEKFAKQQHKIGSDLAQDVQVTQVEKETVMGMYLSWVKSRMEVGNGKAE